MERTWSGVVKNRSRGRLDRFDGGAQTVLGPTSA
jgi:hypothetical protein